MHRPSSKQMHRPSCSSPQCPADRSQTPSPPILAPSQTPRPGRATLEPPGRATPSQTGPQPFRPDPHAPQADPAALSRLSRSPASLQPPRPALQTSRPLPSPFSFNKPLSSISLDLTFSILRPSTLSAPFPKRRLQLPACYAVPRAMYGGSCSPRHVEDASISPLKPQLPQAFASLGAIIAPPRLPRMRGAGCCCGGAARGFTRAGAMSDNDDIEVESDEEQPRFQSAADKRAHHNALERKRRDHIKDSFHSLRDSVPSLQGEKASRAQILDKATEYIQYMRRKNHTHQQDIDDLKRQNALLEQQVRALEKARASAQLQASYPADNSLYTNPKGSAISAFDGGSDSSSDSEPDEPQNRKKLRMEAS
uniref:Protein max n=59 Tax=Passeriformes TaxID=9126 RepID=A0A8C3R8F1_9PASS